MATADEILATMAEEAAATDQMAEVCMIDRCTRAVTIPEALRIVGVETDKDVTRRQFRVLCSYRGTNLSTFRIRIHFMNANKEKDIYYVTDAAQDGEYLTFSWVISRNATKYKGKLQFIACMVCDGGTDEEREWNSTLGEFTVLEGLEVELTDGEEEQARDAITQLLAIIDARESEAVEAIAAQGTNQVEKVKAAGAAQEHAIEAKGAATLETIPDDYATLYNNVQKNAADILMQAPAIVETATGSIVTITDGAARPAVEVISHIEPVQSGSGDPSPDNVRPISGTDSVAAKQTGRNMVKPSFGTITTDGITFTANADGSVTITGTAGSTVGQRISDNAMDVFLPKGISFHIFLADAAPNAAITLQAYIDGQSKLNSQGGYLTIPETAASAYLRIRVAAGAEVDETIHPMVTADDDETWEVGHAQTFSAESPETVYGGAVDWGAGVLTSTHQIKALDGTEEWTGPDRIKNGTYRYLQTVNIASNLLVPPSNDDVPDAVCSHFVAQPYNGLYNGGTVGFSFTQGRKLSIRCNFETVDELKAYLAAQAAAGTAVTIAYHVTNPQTVAFVPQQLDVLKGTSNTWSSSGETALSYVADTKLYIDQKLAAIAAAALNM